MYRYVAIERQYCSGGQEVANLLAKRLGYKLYDHDILVETAKRLDLPAIYISNLEETAQSNPLFNLSQTALGGLSKKKNIPLSDQIFNAEKQIILDVSQDQNCVFVGRCASHILMDGGDCLNVFIYAGNEYRLGRAVKKENIASDKAASELRSVDKRRSDFFVAHTGIKWGDREFFPLSLDAGRLGTEACVEILVTAVKGGKNS